MNPLLVPGLLLGVLGAATPLLLRVPGVAWLRLAAVPLATLFFAGSFTLAGNGPLLRPVVAALGSVPAHLTPGPAPALNAAVRESPSGLGPRLGGFESRRSALGLGLGGVATHPALQARTGRGPARFGGGFHRLPSPRHTRGAF